MGGETKPDIAESDGWENQEQNSAVPIYQPPSLTEKPLQRGGGDGEAGKDGFWGGK